jgi:membrane protein DedA with SNARE-associated domain
MAAGIMQYPRRKFLFALTAGRGVRFFAVAWLGRIYGRQMISFLARNYKPAMYFLIVLAVATGISTLVYFSWYRPRHNQKNEKLRAKPPGTAERLQ